ncbi:MAG: HAD family phosphatase [Ruminococcus sp.]|nr:HAD family phosphatase [Ruminococcus sp.]
MRFSKFKGIIFDLDGTLINSSHVWSDIDIKFLAKRGLNVPENYFKAVSTMNFIAAAEYTNNLFNLNESIEDIAAEWYEMAYEEYAHNIFLKGGAKEFLNDLKENGVRIALATASSKELFEAVLRNNKVFYLFDFFASTNDVDRGKGFPDVYEYACKGMGLKPNECAVFEDIIEGVRGAKAGGFTAVACLDKHYIADWEDMKQEADFYFEDYNKLIV